jgi:ankyrin repeat protein
LLNGEDTKGVKVNINATALDLYTALHFAARSGFLNIVSFLLQ